MLKEKKKLLKEKVKKALKIYIYNYTSYATD